MSPAALICLITFVGLDAKVVFGWFDAVVFLLAVTPYAIAAWVSDWSEFMRLWSRVAVTTYGASHGIEKSARFTCIKGSIRRGTNRYSCAYRRCSSKRPFTGGGDAGDSEKQPPVTSGLLQVNLFTVEDPEKDPWQVRPSPKVKV